MAKAETPTVIDGRCGDDLCEYKGSYFVAVRCGNCGLEGELHCTKGHEAWRTAKWEKCPRCSCDQLKAGEYIRDGGEPDDDE